MVGIATTGLPIRLEEAGGLALAVTGQTKESTAFFLVLGVAVVGLIVGAFVALAIWFRREILGR